MSRETRGQVVKWRFPASLPMKTMIFEFSFIYLCFAAAFAVALIGQCQAYIKLGSALFPASLDSDAWRQRLERAAERHKPRPLGGTAGFRIATVSPDVIPCG